MFRVTTCTQSYIYIKEKIKSKRAKRKEKKNHVCADVVTMYWSPDHTDNMQLEVTMHLLAVGGITVEGVRIKPLFIYIDSYYLFLCHMELEEEEEEEEPKPKSYIMCTFIRLVHGYGLFFSFNGF